MNRDRDPTQVIGSPATPTPSDTPTTSLPSLSASTATTAAAATADPLAGLSKIKATALLLKQKVAGTNNKPQKQPNKISHPWALNPSTRSASFPSPTTPTSLHSPSSQYTNGISLSSSSATPSSNNKLLHSLGQGGGGKISIKAMIAAREDPSLSCNKMAPSGTQPIPAPQKREPRAGMTKVQLSQPLPPSPSPQSLQRGEPELVAVDRQYRNDSQQDEEKKGKRESIQEQTERPATPAPTVTTSTTTTAATSTPTTTIETPLPVESIPALDGITDLAGKRSSRRRNGGTTLIPSQFSSSPSPASTPSLPPSGSLAQPAFMKAFEDIRPIETAVKTIATEERPPTNTGTTRSSLTSADLPPSPLLASPPVATTSERKGSSVFEKRPSAPRRHTTNSPSSPLSNSPFFLSRHPTPPVPGQSGHNQPMSVVNPTLRQLQTPNIPTNLVQARILQQEEQKRKDEELAKIPITANLRTVKKIQAVIVSEDEDEDPKGSASSSASSTLSAGTATRPRSKTATTTPTSTVPVSVLVGGKRRGDRNHVEPVAIPKRLADQVEHILGRKLAGKGSVLDEREQEREEEEARKASEPPPPIVLGKPRKRAVTSAHIRNLVSSWDTKVEEARELTAEAERIRLFLEEHSSAHTEMPKPKHAPTAEELLRPLPALPPPPSPAELHQLLASHDGSAPSSDGDNGTVGRRRGRTVATSNGSGGKVYGHAKGASVASASLSTTFQPPQQQQQQKTKILLSSSQGSMTAKSNNSSNSSNDVDDKINENNSTKKDELETGIKQLSEERKEDTSSSTSSLRSALS
ncbi:hypothetical protein FBU30_005226, partial [Linnemannia zychae]